MKKHTLILKKNDTWAIAIAVYKANFELVLDIELHALNNKQSVFNLFYDNTLSRFYEKDLSLDQNITQQIKTNIDTSKILLLPENEMEKSMSNNIIMIDGCNYSFEYIDSQSRYKISRSSYPEDAFSKVYNQVLEHTLETLKNKLLINFTCKEK